MAVIVGVAIGAAGLFIVERIIRKATGHAITPVTLPTFARVREVVLFGGGMAGAMYLVFSDHKPDPSVVILVAGMLGLGALFRAEGQRKD